MNRKLDTSRFENDRMVSVDTGDGWIQFTRYCNVVSIDGYYTGCEVFIDGRSYGVVPSGCTMYTLDGLILGIHIVRLVEPEGNKND